MRTLTRDESRALDRAASERFGIPSLLLMEHASLGAAIFAAEILGSRLRGARVWIVCGPGNNGGDGYALARHLHNAGARPEVWSLGDPEALPSGSDTRIQREIVARLGIRARQIDDSTPFDTAPTADLVVDALFGSGLVRAPAGRHARAIELMNRARAPILALDIPSGLDCDRGVPLGACVRARWTATFGAWKRGFLAPEAREFTGAIRWVPIGAPPALLPDGTTAFPPGAFDAAPETIR